MIVKHVIDKMNVPGEVGLSVALPRTRQVTTVPVLKLLWTCVVVIVNVNPVLFMAVFGMVATAPHRPCFKVC